MAFYQVPLLLRNFTPQQVLIPLLSRTHATCAFSKNRRRLRLRLDPLLQSILVSSVVRREDELIIHQASFAGKLLENFNSFNREKKSLAFSFELFSYYVFYFYFAVVLISGFVRMNVKLLL